MDCFFYKVTEKVDWLFVCVGKRWVWRFFVVTGVQIDKVDVCARKISR